MLNRGNPFAIGYKLPVTLNNLSQWVQVCGNLVSYFLALIDENIHFLMDKSWNILYGICIQYPILSRNHTGTFNMQYLPLMYVLTY